MDANLYDCNFCKDAPYCNFLMQKDDSIPCATFELMDGIFKEGL